MMPITELFFENVWRQIPVAEDAAGVVTERWFEIAGLNLKLRFLGSALEAYITPAIAHLEVAQPRDQADLVVHCWDCASLAVEFPRAPVCIEAFSPRGEIRGLNDCRFHASFETGGRQLSVFDTRSRQAVYCVGVATDIPHYEIAEPIRAILSWFMREHDRQLIHAAAVGNAQGGVLLIGQSGAGKSNTALGCIASSLQYAADDFCAVSTAPIPIVYSIYCSGKTHIADWTRHGFLADLDPNFGPPGEKAIYYLNRKLCRKLILEFPLKAILLPRRAGNICEMRPVPPVAALRMAAPDTAKLLPDAGAEVMRHIAHLVRTIPCYELLLGAIPERIPEVILTLLNRGAPATRCHNSENNVRISSSG